MSTSDRDCADAASRRQALHRSVRVIDAWLGKFNGVLHPLTRLSAEVQSMTAVIEPTNLVANLNIALVIHGWTFVSFP
jgi:hypothetical protein